MTKVSSITPCFNMERYMEGFLENLSTQTHKDLELVLDPNTPSDREHHKLVERLKDKLEETFLRS